MNDRISREIDRRQAAQNVTLRRSMAHLRTEPPDRVVHIFRGKVVATVHAQNFRQAEKK
jgi:hypothetical protein